MKNLFKTAIVFLCMLNLVSTDVFASIIQNKKEKVFNYMDDIKQDYLDNVIMIL